jgi:phosphatidylglycerophosphate synthase
MSKSNDKLNPLKLNVPNTFTAIRLVLTIAVAFLLVKGTTQTVFIAGILLIVAWISDGLDGYLARKLGQATLSGAIFDIVVDRILMGTILILSIILGYWDRTSGLMPLNPYPYALLVLVADIALLSGLVVFFIKSRKRNIIFPIPTLIARYTFSIQMATLAVAITNLGPDWLLAGMMYVTIIFTLIAAYSYLKKGSYIFTD